MLKHIESKRPDPRDLVPGISPGSVELITRLIAVRPEKRPQSADAVVEEITALLPTLPKLFSAAPPVQHVSRKRRSEIVRIPAQVPASGPRDSSSVHRKVRTGFWAKVKRWLGR